jgi:hypothetical protein
MKLKTRNKGPIGGRLVGGALLTIALALLIGCGGSGGFGGSTGGSSGGSTGGSSGGSTGGGSGGGNDLATDLVIDHDRTLGPQVKAKNLTIAAGAKLTVPDDAVIQVAGKTTLDGRINASGKLTLIPQGGLDVGSAGRIEAGDGDVVIVSSPADVPTEAEMQEAFDKKLAIGVEKAKSRMAPSGRDLFGNPTHLPPIVWLPGARQRNLWVNVLGPLHVGGTAGGPPITYTLPDGAPGANRTGDNAVGGNGKDGGSVALQADRILVTGPVTFNLGSGGDGGSAIAGPATSAKAIAKGGNGGNTGKFIMASAFLGILHGIDIQQPLTLNFGRGGRGGDATATGLPGEDGKPGKDGHNAKATGGDGGLGALPGSAGSDVTGLFNLIVNSNNGGDGGDATTTGGRGGNDLANPGTHGGKGGKATSIGGHGGDATTSLAGGVAGALADGPGGNGGNATANGGRGGDGSDCCGDDPAKGGDGGGGGEAIATPGDPGQGNPNGAAGMTNGVAGDGGSGGDGMPPGAGGTMGMGTHVPNGVPGVPGNPCGGGGGGGGGGGVDVREVEPNDLEDAATLIPPIETVGGVKTAGGSLADLEDKDHFVIKLDPGTYVVRVLEKPQGASNYFLDIGGGNGTVPAIDSPTTFTVEEGPFPVFIGMFGGIGSYKLEVRRIE